MNINEYTKESERRIIRALQDENEMLRAMLRRKGITVPDSRAFKDISRNDEEYDSDQGGRILSRYITDDMAKVFFLYFWGRMDVYAVRGKNGGYFPKCKNAFKLGCPKKENPKTSCKDCEHKEWLPLGISAIKNHLIGMMWKEK